MTKIGENIKKLRQVKNLTQQSFADLFEVTRGNISSYEEKRAEPKIETIFKIAKYFSIPIQHLIEKNLTVNEILHFDNYFEEADTLRNVKNLSAIPFLSREIIQAKKDLFSNIEDYPSIYFPIYNSHQFIAIEYSSSISSPIDFEQDESSILFFEHLEVENLHLTNEKFGLYLTNDEVFIGKFIQSNNQLILELNQWKQIVFDVENIQHFYQLYSVYKKV
ncbi:DNA-binding transcriptional regulator, XRE-family HTH domain [Algoriella xinjiangensis]|uniref:DNA-binding transcriptional regulator, XRE-family HTH domain n=1 Tax=Algoriella xinjiangensis TaxID=684065 RepID=A0A1I4UZ01_9FLAO|nr:MULTISPECIES: helix-turn-helix transcriptional regulator [Algoriella]MBO6213451.1 helix-turn-helix transcriptional regulator [Algoriella sp.]SFM94151.1 DNA-binding transcriptional regulator, XRE-family HTH domain [Algoriella xinjiangensis]VDH18084.1 transcriptional regulator, y4mF family [Algoriella xinjiangensis]